MGDAFTTGAIALVALFWVSLVSIFMKRNCPATTATLTMQAFQAVKYICKAIFKLKTWEIP
jgi:hypothetical protein